MGRPSSFFVPCTPHVLWFSLAVQRITELSLTGKWAVSAVTLQVEGTERDVHRAEKSDDFVDQFHDFYPAIVVVISVTQLTKQSLLFSFLSINSFVTRITKYLKYLFNFKFIKTKHKKSQPGNQTGFLTFKPVLHRFFGQLDNAQFSDRFGQFS